MYKFAKGEDDLPFLPWCSIVLVYTGVLQMVIAAVNWCDAVHRITRFSGEIFGLLIAGLSSGTIAISGSSYSCNRP